ncbi:MAG: amino acid adenylation domain-containing protein [Pyrinomonadaceae bacterium]
MTRAERSNDQAAGRITVEPQADARPGDKKLVRACERNGPAPLSCAQERLWFLDQINPADVSSNLSRGIRILGALDRHALEQAIAAVISCHDALRTTFARTELSAGTDGQPKQLIAATRQIPLPLIDLCDAPPIEREKKAQELARTEARRPFDLTLGPLVRTTLLKLDEREHILLLNTHQIVSDDASTDVFFREVWDSYGNLPSVQPARSLVQFADYAALQCSTLDDDTFKKHADYWKSKLADIPAVIDLPTDRPRPPMRSWRGGSVSIVLRSRLRSKLRVLSESEDATLFMTFLTAFQILLARYNGRSDIVVGCTALNRDFEGTQDVIGPFADLLPYRLNLSGRPTFRQLLAQARQTTLEAQQHHAIPLAKLIDELHVERNLSYAPLFQVALNLKSRAVRRRPVAGLEFDEFEFDRGVSQFDLALDLFERDDEINTRLEYNADLFTDEMARRMLGHLEVVLEGIVKAPDREVWELPLLTEAERRQLLVEWPNTEATYPREQCFHQLFEIQAARTPERTAVVYRGVQLTYGELNRRANQLAHYLRTRGTGPDVVVVIYMHRSIEMLVGLLGILKAGGAYLPLDPSYPSARLSFMIDDAQAALVLTQESLRSKLPDHRAQLVCLDSEWLTISKEPEHPLVNVSTPLNLVYIIYTSGSTGRPKGVMITHSGLGNYLSWCTKTYAVEEGGGSLVHSPLGFDLTVTSLLAPLVCGQQVTLLPEAEGIDGLSRALSDCGDYSLLKITPSHLEALSYSLAPEAAPGATRSLIIGGDALFSETLQFWRREAPYTRLINEYGPTETVVGCCAYEVPPTEAGFGPVPVGRPVANTQAYILDGRMEVVPIGVPGELYIGGAGVARGYLKWPELTAEKFLPHPFAKEPGARFYRTGDLARYLSGGTIEFLGRVDHQVKIRGHRIELGEIETTLTQHAGVRECVVIARDGSDRAKELVAYVVPEREATLSVEELRSSLRAKVPEYIVPSAFVILETLPLTSNGKLDRRALPAPELSRPDLHEIFVGPRDPLEEQLVKTFEKVLVRKPVGIRDNFFALGGDSLLAVRLFAQIENRFGKKLPLATLFKSPTIEQLAQVLRRTESKHSCSSLVPVQPQGSLPPLFCIHAGGANVLIYRPLARHLGKEQPVYALQARGLDGLMDPLACVEEMATHYIREIRSVQSEGPYYLLGASFGGLVAFEMAHQLNAEGQEIAFLAMLNTNCPVYTLAHRFRCHLGHFKQRGLRSYAQSIARAIAGRVSKRLANPDGNNAAGSELQALIDCGQDIDDALIRTVLGIYHASEAYHPVGYAYSGRITFFWANDDEVDFEDNRLGWQRLAASGFEVYRVPGTHASIREEPNVALLVAELQPCLERARIARSNCSPQ